MLARCVIRVQVCADLLFLLGCMGAHCLLLSVKFWMGSLDTKSLNAVLLLSFKGLFSFCKRALFAEVCYKMSLWFVNEWHGYVVGAGRGVFLSFFLLAEKTLVLFSTDGMFWKGIYFRRILSAVVIVFAYRTIGKELIFSFWARFLKFSI